MEQKAEHSKRPADTAFKQQRLPAWQPLLTPAWVIGTFALVGCIFLPIGIVITDASNKVTELRFRYDEACALNSTCNVNITVSKDMSHPIYMYYELTNYYQNHRRYVKSRDDAQLRGDLSTSVGTCDPIETFNTKTIVPCGLIAYSVFNDTFSTRTCSGSTCNSLPLQETDISWKSDREEKFEAVPIDTSLFTTQSLNGVQMPPVNDEHFIVWMRTAGLPTFKKLYGIINQDLAEGSHIDVTIQNHYPVDTFDGEKAIVLSTTSWLGGKNPFLGYAYIVIGCLSLVLAIGFFVKHKVAPRKLGDMSRFTWARVASPVE